MKNFFSTIQESFTSAWGQAYIKVMEILPDAAWAIAIVAVGLITASAFYFLTIRVLEFFAVDKLAGKTPLDRLLKSMGFQKNISEIIALLIFWLVVFVTLVLAAETLDLEQVSGALAVVTHFIPKLIVALLISVFGMLLAKFLQVLVIQALSRAEMQFAKSMGCVVYYVVLVFVLYLALEQLGIDLSFFTTNVILVFCVLLLIFGLAATIASRTLLENVLACYQLRQMISVGDKVIIDQVSGEVISFSSTGVQLKTDGGETVLPALQFFTSTYTVKKQHD